jgi:hypothetical protein
MAKISPFKYSDFVASSSSSATTATTNESSYDPRNLASQPSRRSNLPNNSMRTNNDDNIQQFIVVRLEYEKEENPCNTLMRSAGFCKMTIAWDTIPMTATGSYQCIVKLQNVTIHTSTGF